MKQKKNQTQETQTFGLDCSGQGECQADNNTIDKMQEFLKNALRKNRICRLFKNRKNKRNSDK